MKTKGLLIQDISMDLKDLLKLIPNGDEHYWGILWLDAVFKKVYKNISSTDFEKMARAPQGYPISWGELNELSESFYQIIDARFIGCKDPKNIHQYKTEIERYETCDIVIDAVDTTFCLVFTKNEQFYNNIKNNFEIDEYVDTDFYEKKD